MTKRLAEVNVLLVQGWKKYLVVQDWEEALGIQLSEAVGGPGKQLLPCGPNGKASKMCYTLGMPI